MSSRTHAHRGRLGYKPAMLQKVSVDLSAAAIEKLRRLAAAEGGLSRSGIIRVLIERAPEPTT